MAKKTFKLSGLYFVGSSLDIEGELEEHFGVQDDCNFIKQMIEVGIKQGKIDDNRSAEVPGNQGFKIVGRG